MKAFAPKTCSTTTARRKNGWISSRSTKDEAHAGLTGVTVNAMALIAPGAFLWITFVVQAGYSFPSGMSMWAGILAGLCLAFATAVSYSEVNKLYPGAGSSYLFAEQAFLNHSRHFASREWPNSSSVRVRISITGSTRGRWPPPSAS